MSALAPAQIDAALRMDFYLFLVRCFAELHGGRKFSPARHAEVLAARFRRSARGA